MTRIWPSTWSDASSHGDGAKWNILPKEGAITLGMWNKGPSGCNLGLNAWWVGDSKS